MASAVAVPATHPPGPPELLPCRPDAIVDLQTADGVALVGGQWRYSDATVEGVGFVELGSPEDPLGPGTVPNRTYEVLPHAQAADFDDSSWEELAPADTMSFRARARRIAIRPSTAPPRVGTMTGKGTTSKVIKFQLRQDPLAK